MASVNQYDILVYGATPCGISAAITGARYGKKVLLVAPLGYIGGLMSSGLSCTDLRFRHAHGGIFKEFTENIYRYYTTLYGISSQQVKDSNNGIWFEPHVAEKIFNQMLLDEANISLITDMPVASVEKQQQNIVSVILKNEEIEQTIRAAMFVDASYEGDLAAAAGVAFTVGREAREKFAEPYAGYIFLKNPGLQVLPGSTGEGDERTQAYNFRLMLTNVESNKLLFPPPADYNREEYVEVLHAALKGAVQGIEDVIRLSPLPNGKYNGNNRPNIISLDLPEANTRYPNGNWQERADIVRRYRNYTLGLLYFMQNDPELPVEFINNSRKWGFCKDEFQSTGGLSRELYIREARRIKGVATFTSHDVFLAPGEERTPQHDDAVAIADYQVDSHIVQRRQPGWPQYEGHVYLRPLSKPASVPYGVMVPAETDRLVVPGAVSATHLGFSVLRMEPVWMSLGQAAATAACMAIDNLTEVRNVDVNQLQRLLLESNQVISFFFDVDTEDKLWELLNVPFEKAKLDHVSDRPVVKNSKGVLFFATKGFFNSYYARPNDPLTRYETAVWFCQLARLQSITREPLAKTAFYIDVDAGHFLYREIMQLTDSGIMQGWQNGNGFYGAAVVARSEALEMISKYHEVFHQWPSFADRPDILGTLMKEMPWDNTDAGMGYYITRGEFLDILYSCFFNTYSFQHQNVASHGL
jgi:hypothetical protein